MSSNCDASHDVENSRYGVEVLPVGMREQGRDAAKSMMNRPFTNSTTTPGTLKVYSHSVSESSVTPVLRERLRGCGAKVLAANIRESEEGQSVLSIVDSSQHNLQPKAVLRIRSGRCERGEANLDAFILLLHLLHFQHHLRMLQAQWAS